MALTENQIRPDRLRAAQREKVQSDADWLQARASSFVKVPCPACETDKPRPEFEKEGLQYVSCPQCKTVYISPRPDAATLAEFYRISENYKYWNEFIFPASEASRREHIFKPRVRRLLELCRRHRVDGGALLEVGAGFGIFCEELQRQKGFRAVTALEPVPTLAQTCRERGLAVMETTLEDADFNEDKFDALCSFEVIEHLFWPKTFFQKSAQALKQGGLLVVTCPNFMGFEISTLREKSDSVEHGHLNYFNPRSLAMLAAACGFEVLETLTPGELDAELVRKKILNGDFHPSEKQKFLQTVLVRDWEQCGESFQRFLSENLLSSHQWLVARKL